MRRPLPNISFEADGFAAAQFQRYATGDISVLRPIGVKGVGDFPWTLVGSVALLLFLLRYLSQMLVLSPSHSTKEVSMVKTLTARIRMFFSSTVETMWAIGASSVVVHLSA
jgi:hypothetical protein